MQILHARHSECRMSATNFHALKREHVYYWTGLVYR
ncbi:hypothetical protein M3J09_004984 [Ascochyta lentis]